MKKVLLTLSMAAACLVNAQLFSTGTVSLGSSGMTVKLVTDPTTVTITLTGDSNSMLGIGFGSSGMASGSDGFIYNSSANRDYTFGGYTAPTADASQDWTQTSNTVSGSTRTVVATRLLAGGSGDFAIQNAPGSINIFYARTGGSQAIAYHSTGLRGYATLTMGSVLATGEVAAESKKVVLYPNPAKETFTFKSVEKIKNVDIYEATGRKVKSVKVDGKEVNISELRPGNYYLEITLKDGSTVFEQLIKK